MTQAAEYSRGWKLVENSQEYMREIAYLNCDPMVVLIAFSWTNDSSYVRINTIKFKVEGEVEWLNVNGDRKIFTKV